MNQPCETCTRPIADGAKVCAACAHVLDAALADVCGYHGLAYDLDLTLSRQSRMGVRDGSRPTEAAVPYDARASRAAGELRGVLTSWARLVIEETGDTWPQDTLTAVAAYLRKRVGWLRHHEAAAEAYGEIVDAVRDARRIVDRPAERLYAGPCDCGEDLYASLHNVYVTCASDAHEEPVVWPVEDRRRWLLRSAEDVLATTTEISRALTRYSQPVTPEAIRGYKARGRLFVKGERIENGRTVALFRLGDVLKLVIPEDEKASA